MALNAFDDDRWGTDNKQPFVAKIFVTDGGGAPTSNIAGISLPGSVFSLLFDKYLSEYSGQALLSFASLPSDNAPHDVSFNCDHS